MKTTASMLLAGGLNSVNFSSPATSSRPAAITTQVVERWDGQKWVTTTVTLTPSNPA